MRSLPRPALALRLAIRGLHRDAGTTLLAVAVLALGLALPATFFSFLVGAVRPLPVPDGASVVRVDVLQPERGGRLLPVLPRELDELRGAPGLQALGGFHTFAATLVDRDRAATRVAAAALTAEVLPLLSVEPVLGRLPAAGEDDALLLGERVWRDAYQADPSVPGRTVSLNGEPRTVVGVMPEGFRFPFNQGAWIPASRDGEVGLELVGRLAPGGSADRVESSLTPRWANGDVLRDAGRTGGRVRVDGFTKRRGEGGEAAAFLGLVLIALCLLLIACANVANLLLVRATRRVRALGIQSALGAGRSQIGLQLLTESLLVALLGGACGLLLAGGAIQALERLLATQHFGYFWMRLALDGAVVGFVCVLVLGTALASGILPVVRVLSVDLHRLLKEEDAGVGGGGGWSRGFVTVQLAFSCSALVAAGLTGRAMMVAADFGTSLPGEEVLVASVDPDAGPASPEELLGALRAVPGALEVTLARGVPGFGEPFGRLELENVRYDRWGDRESVGWNAVTHGYFSLFGAELVDGRLLAPSDRGSSSRVAVVSESFVRRFSPERSVLGRRLRVVGPEDEQGGTEVAWHTVVGVVQDIDLGGGERARADRVYLPLADGGPVMVAMRTAGPALAAAPGLREALAELAGGMPVWDVRTLADVHAYLVRVPRTLAALALVGGLGGLLVAAVGLFGLLSFRVRERRRELGIRLALGAGGADLAREVVDTALRQLLPAVVVGLGLAWLAAPALGALLLGIDPRSPRVYVAVALAFLTVGLLAALGPALRARAVKPARVLRGE